MTERDEQLQRFLLQTERNAEDLRKNPLMLGLMAWIFNSRGDVPANRPEIYRECAILMFDKWDQDRNIHADVPDDFDRLQLFSFLADKIFEDRELRAGVSSKWLQTEVQSYLMTVYEKKNVAYQNANKLVKYMCERAWAMTEVGENTYTFTHQTFIEYFFAMHLDDTNYSVSDLMMVIAPKVVNREWDVVSHLALQIKTHRRLKRQEDALKAVLGLMKQDYSHPEQKALVAFCARALEYLPGPEVDVKAVVTTIIRTCLDFISAGEVEAARHIVHCEQVASERRDFVKHLIVSEISSHIIGKDVSRCRSAVILISPSIFGAKHDRLFSETSQIQLSASVCLLIKARLKQHVMALSDDDVMAMQIQWQWYEVLKDGNLKKYGLDPIYKSIATNRLGLDGLTSLIIASDKQYSSYFDSTGLDVESVHNALLTISRNLNEIMAIGLISGSAENDLNGPPIAVYHEVFTSLSGDLEKQVGATLVLAVASIINGIPKKQQKKSYNESEFQSVRKFINQFFKVNGKIIDIRIEKITDFMEKYVNIVDGE